MTHFEHVSLGAEVAMKEVFLDRAKELYLKAVKEARGHEEGFDIAERRLQSYWMKLMELEEMYERLFIVSYSDDVKYQNLTDIEDEVFKWYRMIKRGDELK